MPDIEGVPYETAGGKLDQPTAQALAARHREVAAAGVSAASAAIAPVQSQVSALSSSVDQTLVDAKAYTDSKVAVTGGYIVVSETEPTETERNGLPVIWIDPTAARDPGAWQAAAPTFQGAVATYTIPQDEGALYLVGGTVKGAGTHSVDPPATVTVTAQARAGYTLTGTTSWTYTFEPTPLDLAPLGALITADAPSHHVTLKDGDYTDKGSAPLTWTAESGVTAGTWGAMVSGTSGDTGGRVVSQSTAGIGVLGGLSTFTVEFVGAWDRAGSMLSQQADVEIKSASTVAYDNGFKTIKYTPVEAGTPAHYALVLDAGTLTAYRNGTVMGTAAFTTTRSMTYPLYVGYTSDAQVGQVAIYRGKALSAARIAEHAQAVTG